MPATWDDATDKQLLLSIIHSSLAGAPKWEQVAPMMGQDYTTEALRQRFKRLKAKAKERFGEPPTPIEEDAPKRRGGKKAMPKRKKKDAAEEIDGEVDGESPEKKVKREEDADEL